MGPFELLRFGSPDALVVAAAERWVKLLRDRPPQAPPWCVALPGGRILPRLLHEFTQRARHHPPSLAGVHFFWGDERCVAPTSVDSNFAVAQLHLLQPLKIAEPQIHRIRGEFPPAQATAEASTELVRIAPGNTAGQPVLDLILLGMGEDGHVASLFPGEPEATWQSAEIYRAVRASKPPPERITLGYGTLAAAREVWILASGPAKAAALRDSLAETGTTPLARVGQLRKNKPTLILTDIRET